MARLILETQNGSRVIRRDLPENVSNQDILYADDYFARKLWNRDDIKDRLEVLGYDSNEKFIDEVINSGKLKSLNDCTDSEWNCIDNAIEETISNMKDDGDSDLYMAYYQKPDIRNNIPPQFSYRKLEVIRKYDFCIEVSGFIPVPEDKLTQFMTCIMLDTEMKVNNNFVVYYSNKKDNCVKWLETKKSILLSDLQRSFSEVADAAIKEENENE
jgi:hypothetical protein